MAQEAAVKVVMAAPGRAEEDIAADRGGVAVDRLLLMGDAAIFGEEVVGAGGDR